MKTTLLYSLLVTAAMSFATPAFAEEAKQSIAIVNVQQIMKDSTAAKNVREQVEAKQKSFQAPITKKEEELQKEDQELGKQKSILKKEDFETKVRAFRSKVTDMQKDVQTKKSMLDNAYEHSLNDIQKVIVDIIADLAKEKGFNVALPTSQVLFAEKNLDISTEVLDRLNKKLPKVDVKFEAPAADDKKSDKK